MKRLLVLSLCLTVAGAAAYAVVAGEVDDFEGGTTENWQHPQPTSLVTNQATGGPGGAGDNYLRVVSNGTTGAGSRLAVVNRTQWIGDYNALGSEVVISMDLANQGAGALAIRLGVEAAGSPTTRFISTSSFALPADGVWRPASFTLSTAEMTSVQGSLTLAQVLGAAIELRIVGATGAIWMGDVVAATLGIDNIDITQLPVELQSFTIE